MYTSEQREKKVISMGDVKHTFAQPSGYLAVPALDCTHTGALTTFGLREALMQPEDHPLHKVLNLKLLRTSHKHHPVVGEPLSGGLLPQLGPVPKFQLHLHRALREERGP